MFRELQLKNWYHKAFNALVDGNYERTEKYFRKIAQAYPGKMGNSYNLGLVKLATGEYAKAEEFFLAECEQFGTTFNRSKTLGDLYYIWGKADKAKQHYAQALEECEKPELRRMLTERIAKCSSESSFSNVLQSHAKFEEGIRLEGEGDPEGAEKAYRAALELDSSHFQAANNLGSLILNNEGDPSTAIAFFERAARYSDLPGIAQNLGKAEALLKQRKTP